MFLDLIRGDVAVWKQVALSPGSVVRPDERLSWPRTILVGMQHVVAMFGATFIAAVLMGLNPATALFFSGVATLLFIPITRNRVPSYLGSSFAFIAPVLLITKEHGGVEAALGGIVAVGAALVAIGLVVHFFGHRWLNWLMPPVVTGIIVCLIGLNLAPAAKNSFFQQEWTALVTLVAILFFSAAFKGFIGRVSIFVGVLVGYAFAATQGQIDMGKVNEAAWLGFPDLTHPTFSVSAIVLMIPVVIVLAAENIGHVKGVAEITGQNLDDKMGLALVGDGVGTMVAGANGGTGTTTYAENIGVMSATRVYSTAAYVVAGLTAMAFGMSPKFGALINTVPPGVIGGATTVLFGMIAVLGIRIIARSGVRLDDNASLMAGAIALIAGAADYTFTSGDFSFNGIAVGSVGVLLAYHGMRFLERRRGRHIVATPGAVPVDERQLDSQRSVTA